MPEIQHKLAEPDKELRILVVFSNPRDDVMRLADINTEDTQGVISSIRKLAKEGSVKVWVVENPTREELEDALKGVTGPDKEPFRPHIVHFIGHGDTKEGLALEMSEREKKELAATKTPPRAAWCDKQSIIDLFPDNPPPRLVFLHACNCAKADTLESFSDLARELVLARIPAVIAMQYEIKPKDAVHFCRRTLPPIG